MVPFRCEQGGICHAQKTHLRRVQEDRLPELGVVVASAIPSASAQE